MDFISMSCEGPPTSMWAENQVRPNISCIGKILSEKALSASLVSVSKAPPNAPSAYNRYFYTGRHTHGVYHANTGYGTIFIVVATHTKS